MVYQKYSGAGNDFLIVNNLKGELKNYNEIVNSLISLKGNEKFDGVIFIEDSDISDFKMNYFNKDGTSNALCGNGLRCVVKYIEENNLSNNKLITVEAVSKIFRCEILDNGAISVGFPPPEKIKLKFKLKVRFGDRWQLLNANYVDVGSPHIVIFIKDIEDPLIHHLYEVNVNDWGRSIRMHKDLLPDGANVNFVEILSYERSELAIRSFERGVEGETLSCGTGAISSAIISYGIYDFVPPFNILTQSGEFLSVNFEVIKGDIRDLTLAGSARKISD
jgi:diaminopimelate epimerase